MQERREAGQQHLGQQPQRAARDHALHRSRVDVEAEVRVGQEEVTALDAAHQGSDHLIYVCGGGSMESPRWTRAWATWCVWGEGEVIEAVGRGGTEATVKGGALCQLV